MQIKKTILCFAIFASAAFSFVYPLNNALADTPKEANIYFFWGKGCPHCAKEKPFLKKLQDRYPNVNIFDFEIYKSKENRDLLVQLAKKLNADATGVPFTVVGERYFVGWLNEETTGAAIEKAVQCVFENVCQDIAKSVIEDKNGREKMEREFKLPEKLELPLFGEISTKNISLPVLTVIIGALDGFNPCAMWTLIFLISLLLGMQDRLRMWLLGGAFIVASAAVYFMFLAAWLNLLLFLGFVFWVRVMIGLVAVGGGGYYLKEYFTSKDGACKVAGGEKRRRVFEKIRALTHESSFWLALGGIIILAFAVNLVELICSAGLPAVYTQILTLSNLAKWQYYLYISLYILIFMLDDLIVFFAAMITLQMTGLSAKYSRASHLIGGALMAVIGLLLIFKPELLMFG